jgi:hypothetical protein
MSTVFPEMAIQEIDAARKFPSLSGCQHHVTHFVRYISSSAKKTHRQVTGYAPLKGINLTG